MESRTVTIQRISFIPFVTELFDTIRQAVHIAFAGKFQQSRLDHRSKQQPVVFPRLDGTATFKFRNHPFLSLRVQVIPQLGSGTQQSLSQESGIHQRLIRFSKDQIIGRIRVYGILQAFHCQFDIFITQLSFGRIVRPQFQPRGNTAYQTTYRFQMREVTSVFR